MAETDKLADATKLIRDLLRDYMSPFPMETKVVAAMGMGDTSIERARAWIKDHAELLA